MRPLPPPLAVKFSTRALQLGWRWCLSRRCGCASCRREGHLRHWHLYRENVGPGAIGRMRAWESGGVCRGPLWGCRLIARLRPPLQFSQVLLQSEYWGPMSC